jgi:hypothetical protein
MEKDLLPISITRNLNDKLYEKRKLGALEIEALVKYGRFFLVFCFPFWFFVFLFFWCLFPEPLLPHP